MTSHKNTATFKNASYPFALSLDGKTLASETGDSTMFMLWDVASGKNTAMLEGHRDSVDFLSGEKNNK
jgi:hypothetical protein